MREVTRMVDFRTSLPVADVRIGPKEHLRIYADFEMTPPLVEVEFRVRDGDVLNLTADQAETIGRGLLQAAAKARAQGDAHG
jgi:hypothetical protein